MTDNWKVEQGDCRDIMRTLPDNSVDAIVSDPPYGLSFMGKEWDHGVPGVEFWTEALRVAKPAGASLRPSTSRLLKSESRIGKRNARNRNSLSE